MAGAHEELDVDELACTVADATKALQLDPNNVDALLKKVSPRRSCVRVRMCLCLACLLDDGGAKS